MSRFSVVPFAMALLLGSSLAFSQTTNPAARPAPSPFQSAPGPGPSAQPRQPTGQSVEFKSEAEAKTHCPGDRVVWANLNTKVYHYEGTHNFGKTLKGAYMCERDAGTAGLRAAQNEKPQR